MTDKATPSTRWPRFEGWDGMAEAVETLAEACGAKVFCSQKYGHLRVEFQRPASQPRQMRALHLVAELIEQASDRDEATFAEGGAGPAAASLRQLAEDLDLQQAFLAEAFSSNDGQKVDSALAKIAEVRRMLKNGILEWFDD